MSHEFKKDRSIQPALGTDTNPTNHELNALRAVAMYGTIQSAAQALSLSPHTVDTHLDCLRRKSGLRYLPQLVAWAAKCGWLEEPA